MPKYVLAYRGGSAPEGAESQEQVMAAWTAWFGQLGDAVVDGGAPFGPSRTVGASGSESSALTGYSILSASSLDEAAELASGCPVLSNGGSVDVYKTIQM